MRTSQSTPSKTAKPRRTPTRYTVLIHWHGEYFTNRDAFEKAFPRMCCGSGCGTSEYGNDISFSVREESLHSVVNSLLLLCKRRERSSRNAFSGWSLGVHPELP